MAKETAKVEATTKIAATYEAKEIAQNSPRLFGRSVDLATAALDYNGIERCTLDEAKKLINNFAERKVN